MNPELQRNLWLEYSHYRMITTPLFLAMLFYIMQTMAGGIDSSYSPVLVMSKWLFVFFTIIWGSRQISDALIEEVRQHTWDWQRISSISPWSLLWGKWLGSTIYSWYAGLICLGFAFAASDLPISERLIWTISLICCAIIAQGIALLICLQMFKRDRELIRFRNHIASIIAVSIGLFFVITIDLANYLTHWYGISLNDNNSNLFIMLSLLSFCFWIVLGNYRLIAAELQIYGGIFAWLFFMVFVLFYVSGSSVVLAYFTGIAWLFMMLILEGAKPAQLRILLQAARQHKWRTCAQYMPCWMIALLPVGIYAIGLILLSDASALSSVGIDNYANAKAFYIALFLFFLRDVLVVSLLQNRSQNKKRDANILIYLVVIYWLLPALLMAMGLNTLTALLTPSFLINSLISCFAAGAQIVVLIIILLPHIRGSKTST
ncbi:MAG: hypothetical protein R8L53_00315 [Mariprofundales bacterium]